MPRGGGQAGPPGYVDGVTRLTPTPVIARNHRDILSNTPALFLALPFQFPALAGSYANIPQTKISPGRRCRHRPHRGVQKEFIACSLIESRARGLLRLAP
jgi:hypothetical protein